MKSTCYFLASYGEVEAHYWQTAQQNWQTEVSEKTVEEENVAERAVTCLCEEDHRRTLLEDDEDQNSLERHVGQNGSITSIAEGKSLQRAK